MQLNTIKDSVFTIIRKQQQEVHLSTVNSELQACVAKHLSKKESIRVLEAGCGDLSRISFGSQATLIGIDISEMQLEKNTCLDEKILGDIQTYPLEEEYFDVIISWDVLEHLNDPEKALNNFIRALEKDGIIILALPNLVSYKGILTKLTPYFIHLWFYNYIVGDKTVGTKDTQFSTYLRRIIAPNNLIRFFKDKGLTIVLSKLYEGPVPEYIRNKNKLTNFIFTIMGGLSRLITFGKFNFNHSDFMLVVKKNT